MYIPNRLIKSIDNGQAAIFIGSGLSARVFSQMGKKYPLWSELVNELNRWSLENDIIDETEYRLLNDIIEKNNLTMAAQILRQKASKTDFSSFLDMVFRNDNRFDYIHSLILDIPFNCIMTTNYDAIIESAYNIKYNRPLPVYTWEQVGVVNNYFNEGKEFLFKLHGSFERENTVILAENDYQLLYHNNAFLELLKKIFLSKSVLFVGFGYNDPAIKSLISNLSFDFSGNNCMHYLLIEQNRYNNLEKEFLKHNDRITIIEYENNDKTHSKIGDFFSDLRSTLRTKKK